MIVRVFDRQVPVNYFTNIYNIYIYIRYIKTRRNPSRCAKMNEPNQHLDFELMTIKLWRRSIYKSPVVQFKKYLYTQVFFSI